jgi:hypothetical protein
VADVWDREGARVHLAVACGEESNAGWPVLRFGPTRGEAAQEGNSLFSFSKEFSKYAEMKNYGKILRNFEKI